MTLLRFIYGDARGEISERSLARWSENSLYVQGVSEGEAFPRTYRKDRVVEYLEGEELLLKDAAPPAPTPTPRASLDDRHQILFTGFKAIERQALELRAQEHGLRVMKTPGKTLAFLCIGPTAGSSKVEKAREAGAFIITDTQLLHMFDTGELP